MARLDITEYEFWNEVYRLPKEPGRDQVLPVTMKQTQSKPFGPGTKFIRITSDVTCHYVIGGKDIKVSGDNKRLWPRQSVDLAVNPGDFLTVVAGGL